MKMSPELFQAIKEAIDPINTPELQERYRTGNYPRAKATKDVNMRYRWDLLWGAFWPTSTEEQRKEFNELLDTHIDTALRRIVPNIIIQLD